MSTTVLIIRDGWGQNPNPELRPYNAIELANIPFSHQLSQTCPRAMIKTSGLDVGLPAGVMGNSEVGHQNIGAGRIVDQEIVRIDKAFASGSLVSNPVLLRAFEQAQRPSQALHLMGIASDIGVHGLLQHLYGLLDLAKSKGIKKVFIHCFMDGRDSPPTSGASYIQQIQDYIDKIGVGQIASVSGRYFAMDRDKRWDRVERAYRALIGEGGAVGTDAKQVVADYYNHPTDASCQGDEFIPPTMIVDAQKNPIGPIRDGDAVIFYNYRGDRPREITRAFIDQKFDGFAREQKRDLFYATMTEYQKDLCKNVIFPKPPAMPHILGEVVSAAGIKQFRCAETEKYAHVTFFFNDYREQPFSGEDRFMAPSPKDVATYDQKPQMAAQQVASAAVEAILSGKYGLVIMNFANGDMVGHTGSLPAAIRAVEAVDKALQSVLKAVDAVKGMAFITADHGNCEQMFDPVIGGPHTFHTTYVVEGLLYGSQSLQLKPEGRLADIAPTLLDLMGVPKPVEMTGESLIVR